MTGTMVNDIDGLGHKPFKSGQTGDENDKTH